MSDYILELNNITKIFPGIKALDNVNFHLKKGEIHALMGENGAGKSTFIKVITGVHIPEEGEIILHGKPITFKNPKEAQNASISAIYQHGVSYPFLSITENIFLGHEELTNVTKSIKWGEMHHKAKELLSSLGSELDPRTTMGELSVAEQQVVEIAKAISTNAEIIIMDEPTAALSKRECDELYEITEKLRDKGVSIIFISHRFEDMYRLASRVTVFRDSKYIGTYNVDEITHNDLIKAMVGREITEAFPKVTVPVGKEILKVDNISKLGYFNNISFSLHRGEILAITGLVGSGRTEICNALFGINKPDSGQIKFEGIDFNPQDPKSAIELGVGYLPEDRQRQGLILDWEIYKNETLSTLDKFTKYTILDNKKERTRAKQLSEQLSVKATSVYDTAGSLSGGNQQKVVIAKVLNADLKIIVLDEPTKGVDVGAKSQIYTIMSDLVKQGYGIIMVSSEMPEVLGVADNILVMCKGKITGKLSRSEATQEKILALALDTKN